MQHYDNAYKMRSIAANKVGQLHKSPSLSLRTPQAYLAVSVREQVWVWS